MEFLAILQESRSPALDFFFSAVTRLGEEAPLLLISFLFIWCFNKKHGYYLCTLGITTLISNFFLKIVFRVPRPWVASPEISLVESAKASALGYSFPSGHTQIATSIYGGIARFFKKFSIQILCVIIILLVAFSRMYLGAHTPSDVIAGIALSAALVFLIHRLFEKSYGSVRKMSLAYAAILALCAAYMAFVSFYRFPADVELFYISESLQNGWKVIGVLLAVWISYIIDVKYTKFETDCVWWGQLTKLILGFVMTFVIKEALKNPLFILFSGHYISHGVRYFLIAFFAVCIWPMTFKIYPKGK